MKKLKITGQLMILYVIIVVVSFVLFLSLTFSRMHSESRELVYDKLGYYIVSTQNKWKNGEKITISTDEGYYFVSGIMEQKYDSETGQLEFDLVEITGASTNIADNLNIQSNMFESLFDAVQILPNQMGGGKGHVTRKPIDLNGSQMYSYYESTELVNDRFYFILALSDYKNAESVGTNLTLQMTLVFAVALAVTLLILIAWSRNHIRRIQRLEKHITNLPKTNYTEEYNDEGNDELAELSRSIENMRLQILRNEFTKQEMLQNISHDIKTPIGIIKSYAEAMQDKHFIENGPDIIIKQSDILYNKTQQLITYNKLSYLTKDKEFEDVNMKRLIESVVNNLKMTRQEIKFELDLDRVYFKGYSDNYSTVIENIIDNALRYAKSLISIKLRENLIEIYNDGEAIDEKFIQQGFKPYEKGSKGKFGLGMSIAVKTLDFFNYKLSVRNENVGVRFIISLKDL